MKKIPFEIIAPQLNKLTDLIGETPNDDLAQKYREQYLALLEGFGWSEKEFDSESLNRIDQSWEKLKEKFNPWLN